MTLKSMRWLVAVIALASISPMSFALTGGNAAPATHAGEGAGSISGNRAGDIHYALDPADPSRIGAVTFMLADEPEAGASIKIALSTTSTHWYPCSNQAAHVTCPTTGPPATLATADQLRLIVA